ncbi:MAG: hypothetical protein ICV66_02885, partial [Chitinophagaceae bacterium]|nr:hypothetical protein [Chitinophagaceae bacterium]
MKLLISAACVFMEVFCSAQDSLEASSITADSVALNSFYARSADSADRFDAVSSNMARIE